MITSYIPAEKFSRAVEHPCQFWIGTRPFRLSVFGRRQHAKAFFAVKAAISKVLGLYDANEQIIHIDESVGPSKQKFLKLHETGHHELPAHRKIFTFFQDCEKSLAPEIADQFEREANNFARFALFQGTTFQLMAADSPMGIKSPMNLAKKFGASNYASAREFARTNHRPCVVYILEPIKTPPGKPAYAEVRRVETSPSFAAQFGSPVDVLIDSDHALYPLLPIGKKMTAPTSLVYSDKNGDHHECLGEAFDTTHNILLLVYPVVLKILSTDILHKTEVGGVRLQIADEAQLRQACDAMLESVTRQVPQARIDGFLVQPMATGGVAELIAGVTHDPVFGPALTVGLGGVLTEIYQDASHRLLPADKGMVQDMLRELTAWPLLDGFRGRPLADVDACCQMVAALSDAQQSLGHRISDIEINPIQVHAQGKGAWGLDALVLFTPQETQGDTV